MDIAKKMEELVTLLRHTGLKGIKFPNITGENFEDWGEDYAIVHSAYDNDLDCFDLPNNDYIEVNTAQLEYDWTKLVKEHFNTPEGDVIVQLHGIPRGCQEIEVYRELGRGKFVRSEDGFHFIMIDGYHCTDGDIVTDLNRIDPWHRAYPSGMNPDLVARLKEALDKHAKYKQVYTSGLGDRKFLTIEWSRDYGNDGGVSIPIDRITKFDLNAPNGGCENAVRIFTDDPDDDYIFAYEGADMIREHLRKSGGVS